MVFSSNQVWFLIVKYKEIGFQLNLNKRKKVLIGVPSTPFFLLCWLFRCIRLLFGYYRQNYLVYCLPPNAPNIANNAKNKATGKIPITVHAVSFAFWHSVAPCPVGQCIESLTSAKIKIPINRATAAPINARINPKLSTMSVHPL